MTFRAVDVFNSEEFEEPAFDPGPPVSIRSLKAAAKRRKRLWMATAFVGLILGASLHFILPAKVTAMSRVYLVEPAGSDPTVAMGNEVSLLQTRTVAEAAMALLHLGPDQPMIAYKGVADGTSILEIKVTGSTPAEAISRTTAVSRAFLQVRARLSATTTNDEVASLLAEVATLQADRQKLASEKSGQQQAASDLEQITTLQELIAQDQESQTSAVRNSAVIDQAFVLPVSTKKTAIKDGLTGLIGGLSVGLIIVIIGELLSDRVRARSDVAAALGAPIELSVGRLP